MRRWLIGIGLCSVACGETSFPRFSSTAGEGQTSSASVADLPTTAPSAPAANQSSTAQSSADDPGAESSPALPVTTPAAEAAPAVPEVPDLQTPLSPAQSAPPSAGEGDSSSPPATETPVTETPVTETPVTETPAVPPDMMSSDPESESEPPGNAEPEPDLPSGAPRVTISLTFDDTYGPQLEAAAILEAHGLRGTFYVNSPQLHRATANPDAHSSMSIGDVLGMQARGHEIGGHTLGHLSLTDVPEVERIREILGDRAQLVHLGLDARSFAYPYGHVEADSDRSLGRPVLEIAR